MLRNLEITPTSFPKLSCFRRPFRRLGEIRGAVTLDFLARIHHWRTRTPPFVLWLLLPERVLPERGPRCRDLSLSGATFRLVPESLRLYDFLFGCALGLTWGTLFKHWGYGALFMGLQWVVLPALLNMVYHPAVLPEVNGMVPSSLSQWFLALPSSVWRFKGERPSPFSLFVRLSFRQIFFIRTVASQDPIFWQPISSPQANLLRSALKDFLGQPKDSGWKEIGVATVRFLLLYCAPVWTAYCLLLVSAMLCKGLAPEKAELGLGGAVLTIAWGAISLTFAFRAVAGYGIKAQLDWAIGVNALHSKLLFPSVMRTVESNAVIRESWAKVTLNAVVAIGVTASLTLLQVLGGIEPAQPQPPPTAAAQTATNATVQPISPTSPAGSPTP